MDLIIRQAQLIDQTALVDVAIKDGFFVKISEKIQASAKEDIQADGRLLSPPFVESHVHLDSTQTLGQPRLNESGTLLEGIQLWGEYKQTITKEKIKENAIHTINWLIS